MASSVLFKSKLVVCTEILLIFYCLLILVRIPPPVISKILSTAPKKYTISWVQPTLPVHQTVLEYDTSYRALNGPKHSRKVSKDRTFIIVDVEYEEQYNFEVQVVTQAGKSGVASETWISHSGIRY